jgi:Flp pilus assembly protein TadD
VQSERKSWYVLSHLIAYSQTQTNVSTTQGNAAFRKGDYEAAVKLYESAHEIESELPHYQLNLAAAHLKLNKYV